MSDTFAVVMAGYQAIEPAKADFDELVGLVKEVVDLDYEPKAPYAFTGTVKRVTFDLKPHAHGDELALHQQHAARAVAHGAAG